MKSYCERHSKRESFSIRKRLVGVVSLALAGLATVTVYGPEVQADELVSPIEADASESATSSTSLTSTKSVEGNREVTTTLVSSVELEAAKTVAQEEGLQLTEEAEQIQPTIVAAEADSKAQARAITKTVEEYKKAKEDYETKKTAIATVETKNQEAQANYQEQLRTYNSQKTKYEQELATYQDAQAKYDLDQVAYQKAKEDYALAKENYAKLEAVKSEEDKAKAQYDADMKVYEAEIVKYEAEFADYQTKLSEYQTALAQYQDAKAAYDKYMTDNQFKELKDVETLQDLTFQRENAAIHTIEGIRTYLTREAQERLNTSNVHQYDSNKLTAADIVSTSPWSNRETEFIQVQEGAKFVVTYDNLNNSSMRENTNTNEIKRVIYRYEILSLPSNDGKGIAAVNADPTVTLTVGASTDQEKPVQVAVDIEFYDKDGKKFDLNNYNAIVALNSLNHWTGASYVDSGDKPRLLTVEAKDTKGNTVRGTWDPYADGSSMMIENNAVIVKSGVADFGTAAVTISAENPLKVVAQTASWNGTSFEITESRTTNETTVHASGSGNGHSIGTTEFTYEGKDDVLGSYSVNPVSGEISFTPKKKFETIEHQEFVNVGNNKFIAIPNSSVSYDPVSKEVTALKDNQYIEHGSVFNGESSPGLEGWDNPSSKYLYYGGAGIKMIDGHLVFTAKGANAADQATVYWFAINSNIETPKKPGEEPKEPVKPEKPKTPTPPTITIENLPAIPVEPVAPKAPTPPVVPEAPTPPNLEEVPDQPVKPEASVKWHKNKVISERVFPIPPSPYTPPVPPAPTPLLPNSDTQVPSTPVKVSESQSGEYAATQPMLPNTGVADSSMTTLVGTLLALFGLGLAKKKKEN